MGANLSGTSHRTKNEAECLERNPVRLGNRTYPGVIWYEGLSIECFNPFTENPRHLYENVFFRFTAFEHLKPVVGCVQ